MDYWTIEVSDKMYFHLYRLLDLLELRAGESITSCHMDRAYFQMKKKVLPELSLKQQSKIGSLSSVQAEGFKKALVISKFGIHRYQLKTLVESMNIDFDGEEKPCHALVSYIKKLHDLIILDLTELTEDYSDVILEMKRLAQKYSVRNTVYVIGSSESSELEDRYRKKGADKFLCKDSQWTLKLITYLRNPTPQNQKSYAMGGV